MTEPTAAPGPSSPLFSVIIPTRGRPELFSRALDSVLAQDFDELEVIVVDDGSDSASRERLAQLVAARARVRLLQLPQRPKGHGPAFARNVGAAEARGSYLCFLDDDDLWIDPGHLRRAQAAIRSSAVPVDLYFTHQRALFADGRVKTGPLWLAGLEQLSTAATDADGNRPVDVAELLRAPGFAHLNCSIYRKALYEAIDGMDETLRYENDRDVYLRAIDAADHIVYNPAVVAQHHIPDAERRDNASTAVNQLEKKLFQLRICDKAILGARHEPLRRHARRAKGYALKAVAELLISAGQRREAVFYMREALMVAFSFKWLAYTVLSMVPRP